MSTIFIKFKVSEAKPKKTYVKKIKEFEIIHKKITGLCCINLNGQYYVKTEFGDIPFTKSSYKKSTKRLYSQQLVNKRNVLCVPLEEKDKYCPEFFLPFAPSIYLEGNIIKYIASDKLYFDLINSLDYKDEDSKEQFLFYKENYNEIHKNYLCNLNLLLQL